MWEAATPESNCGAARYRALLPFSWITAVLAIETLGYRDSGATCDPAFAATAAVLPAESLPNTGGGAARHGARLLLPTAVFDAMLETSCCRGGASIDLAPPVRTMLAA